MQNFQDTFKTRKRLFISVFSICVKVTKLIAKIIKIEIKILKANYLIKETDLEHIYSSFQI